MYLGSYTFTGDPAALTDGYDKLRAGFPPDAILFHAAVVVDNGLLVIDACPSKADFEAFSTSPEFAAALDAAGLPRPVVAQYGEVHATVARQDALVA